MTNTCEKQGVMNPLHFHADYETDDQWPNWYFRESAGAWCGKTAHDLSSHDMFNHEIKGEGPFFRKLYLKMFRKNKLLLIIIIKKFNLLTGHDNFLTSDFNDLCFAYFKPLESLRFYITYTRVNGVAKTGWFTVPMNLPGTNCQIFFYFLSFFLKNNTLKCFIGAPSRLIGIFISTKKRFDSIPTINS